MSDVKALVSTVLFLAAIPLSACAQGAPKKNPRAQMYDELQDCVSSVSAAFDAMPEPPNFDSAEAAIDWTIYNLSADLRTAYERAAREVAASSKELADTKNNSGQEVERYLYAKIAGELQGYPSCMGDTGIIVPDLVFDHLQSIAERIKGFPVDAYPNHVFGLMVLAKMSGISWKYNP